MNMDKIQKTIEKSINPLLKLHNGSCEAVSNTPPMRRIPTTTRLRCGNGGERAPPPSPDSCVNRAVRRVAGWPSPLSPFLPHRPRRSRSPRIRASSDPPTVYQHHRTIAHPQFTGERDALEDVAHVFQAA